MHDVFVAHVAADTEVARTLVRDLKANSNGPKFKRALLSPENGIAKAIDELSAEGHSGVVVVSKNFLRSSSRRWELDAVAARTTGARQSVIGVAHGVSQKDVANASPFLARNLTMIDERFGSHDLLGAINRLRHKRRELHEAPRPLSNGRWTISTICPTPLDGGTSAHSVEFFNAIGDLRALPYKVDINAPSPQGLGGILACAEVTLTDGDVSVLHLHAEKVRDRIKLEGSNLEAVNVPLADVAHEIVTARPDLVLLTGANHRDLANLIHDESSKDVRGAIPCIHSTRHMTEEVLADSLFKIYEHLFSGWGEGWTERFALHSLTPSNVDVVTPELGVVRMKPIFDDMLQRAHSSRSRVHGVTLRAAYRTLRQRGRLAIRGPVGSGVSTSVRILSDYLAVDTSLHHKSIVIDLPSFRTVEQILAYCSSELNVRATSFIDLISLHSIGVCIDAADANDRLRIELVQQIEQAGDDAMSKFVFGISTFPGVQPLNVSGAEAIDLPSLTFEELFTVLISELGKDEAKKFRAALASAPPSPAGVYLLASLAKTGLRPPQVISLMDNDNGAAILESIVDSAASRPHLLPALRTIAVLGDHFPLDVLRSITEDELMAENDDEYFLTSARRINDLMDRGIITHSDLSDVSEPLRYSLGVSYGYVALARGMPDALIARFPTAAAIVDVDFVKRFSATILAWIKAHPVIISRDVLWLTGAVSLLLHAGDADAIENIALSLVDVHSKRDGEREGKLHARGNPKDLRDLLKLLREATKKTDSPGLRDRVATFLAETFYKMNECGEAEREYEGLVKATDTSATTRATSLRALGKIAFRRAQYDKAAEYFARSDGQTDNSGEQAQLLVELARLNLRRGDTVTARTYLDAAREQDPDDTTWARLLIEEGNLARLNRDFNGAATRYGNALSKAGERAAESAISLFWICMLEEHLTTPRPEGVPTAGECRTRLENLVPANPGNDLVGVLASFLTYREGASTTANSTRIAEIRARLNSSERLDLWHELDWAIINGPDFYVSGVRVES
jgi:tetratricopeptide (TPR) repeat protein